LFAAAPDYRKTTIKPQLNRLVTIAFCTAVTALLTSQAILAQSLSGAPPTDRLTHLVNPPESIVSKEKNLIREIIEPELLLRLYPTQSRIVVTNYNISTTAISDPSIVDVQVFDANQIEIIGKAEGEATLTFWYNEPGKGKRSLRYLVQVRKEEKGKQAREDRIREFQARVNELFPNSQIMLFPVEDKLIVRGQVRDAEEAQRILQLLGFSGNQLGRGNRNHGGFRRGLEYGGGFGGGGGFSGALGGNYNNYGGGGYGGRSYFPSGDPDADSRVFEEPNIAQMGLQRGLGISPQNIINQLKITGEQQVMLKVRVAELVRASRRSAGADIRAMFDQFELSHLISGGGNATAILSDPDVSFFLKAIANHSYGKILAEPTLVTISGKPARFLAGGQFAVPTTVGVGGVGAASTTFHGFGTQLSFTPTIRDKDLIRLEVSPSFSTINNDAAVGGIPGLSQRSVDTTVDLREGQWLAIAGLIQDEQGGQRTRLPFLGDLPFVGNLFGSHDTTRSETELIVLVSPELVHPLEPEQVPLMLPGMEVTDPTDDDFFVRHQTEGYRGFDFRSTLYPERQAHLNGFKSDKMARQVMALLSLSIGCHVQSPQGTPIGTRMLGSITDDINRQQEDNADAAKFVVYNHEFEINIPLEYKDGIKQGEKFDFRAPERIRGFRLTPYGEDHVYQIADALIQHQESGSTQWHPWDVVVERSQSSKLWDTQYRYPVHFNAELDEARRQTVVAMLTRLGVANANEIVFVGPSFSEGGDATEAASSWSSRFLGGGFGSQGGGGIGSQGGFGSSY